MRYNRGNTQSTLNAAVKLNEKTGKTVYVEPTAYGLSVSTSEPPSFASYYTVINGLIRFSEYMGAVRTSVNVCRTHGTSKLDCDC